MSSQDRQSAPVNQVKVSVMLMTYNHEKYIAHAIDSALMQRTSFDFEIVIGDDCSTDRTRDIVIEYQRQYPDKIRLVLPTQNLGFEGNKLFIEILRATRGQLVALLDGDDYWTSPDKLQKQADFLDAHPECSLCFHDALVVFDDASRPPRRSNGNHQKAISTLEDLWPGCFVETCAAMFRRSAMSEIPDWLHAIEAQDWANYILIAHHGKLGYINEVMGVYRRHNGGIWSKLNRDEQEDQVTGFYEKLNEYLNFRYDDKIREMKTRRYFSLYSSYESSGDLARAAKYLERCVAERPAWLEEQLTTDDVKGSEVWRTLEQKLRLYRNPQQRGESPQLNRSEERPAKTEPSAITTQNIRTGSIVITPDPLPLDVFTRAGRVALSWTSEGTNLVELRVGAPDGALLSRTGYSGRAVTGQWAQDGITFYLQDVSDGLPLTSDNTLATATVKVMLEGEAELVRLRSLPRYYHTVTDIHGALFEILDPHSFLEMYDCFSVRQMYYFRTENPQPYIIDGGANIGHSTLYFKRLYPQSEIIAFEPDSQAFAILERNVCRSGFGGIKLVRAALASKETMASFMLEGSNGSRLARGDDSADERVKTVRLREYLNRRVDLLQLSIEGAETEVITDCADLLGNVERIIIHYHSVADRPQTLHTLLNVLANAGLRLHIKQFISSPQPLAHLELPNGEDMQLYIFGFRQSLTEKTA